MFGQQPGQQDFRHVEQESRQRYERLENAAARRAQLGIQRPKLRERMRHWYCWLTRQKPAER
jgi:hypothetical protein